jgi:hypothetical protein
VRWILAVEPVAEWTAEAADRFGQWGRAAVATPGAEGVEIESVDREGQAAHTGRQDVPRFVAMLSLWADDQRVVKTVLDAAHDHDVARVVLFGVEQCRVRHSFPRAWRDGEPTPGLKKSTFWRANPDFGPDWRERYERHATIVRDHHSSAWQYRQNLLATHDDDGGWDAVSELWWPTADGLIERFYNSPESQRAVREDTVFVGRAMPIVTRHTILRSPPGTDDTDDAASTT